MPISHTCLNCRRELGHIHAVPDPHYGLGVVVCPGCDTAVVRARHPDITFWRAVRHVRKSLQRIVLVALFWALATGAVIGMALSVLPLITDGTANYTLPSFASPEVPFRIGVVVFMTLLSGCIVRVTVPHLKFPLVLGIFLLLVAFFLNVDWLATRLMILVSTLVGADADFHMLPDAAIKRRFLVYPLLIPLILVGMAVGVMFNTMIERGAGKGMLRIRRKRRKRRARLD